MSPKDRQDIEKVLWAAEHLFHVARNPANDPTWPTLRGRLVSYRDLLKDSNELYMQCMFDRIVRLIGRQ